MIGDDALAAAPVVGDYGWGQADQEVEPVIGEPIHGDE